MYVYPVPINTPLPKFEIPLAPGELTVLDLQATYYTTIHSARMFPMLIDYSVDPVNFNAYSEADQQ